MGAQGGRIIKTGRKREVGSQAVRNKRNGKWNRRSWSLNYGTCSNTSTKQLLSDPSCCIFFEKKLHSLTHFISCLNRKSMGNCSCVTHDSKKQFLCDNFMRGLRFINLIMFSQSQSRILVLQIKLVECKGGRTSWVCSYTVLQLSGSRIMTFIKNHGQKEKRKPPDETTAHCINFGL